MRCNERIKFSALLDKALALGFDAVCTGHYARLGTDPDDRDADAAPGRRPGQGPVVRAGGAARRSSWRHALFPLGDTTKSEVRAEAAARGLRVAEKPDSHDICFIADGDTPGWLRRRLGPRPGQIVDAGGGVVGEHDGAYAFTVGQRQGPAAGAARGGRAAAVRASTCSR